MHFLKITLCSVLQDNPSRKQTKEKLARKTVTSETQSWLSGLLSAMADSSLSNVGQGYNSAFSQLV